MVVLAAPPAPAATTGRAAASASTIVDATGDVADDTDRPIAEPRADIISAGADYREGEIAFTLKVAQPTNPATDPNWGELA